jgi:hypothetical protein
VFQFYYEQQVAASYIRKLYAAPHAQRWVQYLINISECKFAALAQFGVKGSPELNKLKESNGCLGKRKG